MSVLHCNTLLKVKVKDNANVDNKDKSCVGMQYKM